MCDEPLRPLVGRCPGARCRLRAPSSESRIRIPGRRAGVWSGATHSTASQPQDPVLALGWDLSSAKPHHRFDQVGKDCDLREATSRNAKYRNFNQLNNIIAHDRQFSLPACDRQRLTHSSGPTHTPLLAPTSAPVLSGTPRRGRHANISAVCARPGRRRAHPGGVFVGTPARCVCRARTPPLSPARFSDRAAPRNGCRRSPSRPFLPLSLTLASYFLLFAHRLPGILSIRLTSSFISSTSLSFSVAAAARPLRPSPWRSWRACRTTPITCLSLPSAPPRPRLWTRRGPPRSSTSTSRTGSARRSPAMS